MRKDVASSLLPFFFLSGLSPSQCPHLYPEKAGRGEGIAREANGVCPYISGLKISGCIVHFAFQEILTQRYRNAVFSYISNATIRAEGLSRNAKTKHEICHIGSVGAQCFAPAFYKACAKRTP